MMASFAHAEHPSQRHVRTELAAQGHEHTSFVIDQATSFAKRIVAAIGSRIETWSEAHHRAVQDRIFWELALHDRAVMEEIKALRARSPIDE
jgi:hypothetical protein